MAESRQRQRKGARQQQQHERGEATGGEAAGEGGEQRQLDSSGRQ